jgi:acyl-CoA thioester hydrolase
MYRHSTQVQVRFYETDKMGFMHHSNYARYYEIARTDCIKHLGYSYKQCEDDGTHMPVVKIDSKFIRPIFYDDLVTISTEIRQAPRFGIITFHHQIHNTNQELVHEGSVSLAMITTATNKRENGPARLIEAIKKYF